MIFWRRLRRTVSGLFLIVVGLSAALFHRNMQRLSELVNKGELDFVLTRPISSQYLVSIRYVDFGDLPTAVAAYYQGLGSVRANGMYADTRNYVSRSRHAAGSISGTAPCPRT